MWMKIPVKKDIFKIKNVLSEIIPETCFICRSRMALLLPGPPG
jgi:hypothetical protein